MESKGYYLDGDLLSGGPVVLTMDEMDDWLFFDDRQAGRIPKFVSKHRTNRFAYCYRNKWAPCAEGTGGGKK